MPTVVQAKVRFGPDTYQVSDAATAGALAIDGGLLVEFDGTTGKIKQAVVDSTKWLGVALYPGMSAANQSTSLTVPSGYPGFIVDHLPEEVAVAWVGEYPLLATNAVLAQGDLVYPGANGKIQKATTTGRAVGIVLEPGGIAANGRGLVRLFQ
jgi:hypothetical protein